MAFDVLMSPLEVGLWDAYKYPRPPPTETKVATDIASIFFFDTIDLLSLDRDYFEPHLAI